MSQEITIDGNNYLINIEENPRLYNGTTLTHYTSIDIFKRIIKDRQFLATSVKKYCSQKNSIKTDSHRKAIYAVCFSKSNQIINNLWKKNEIKIDFISTNGFDNFINRQLGYNFVSPDNKLIPLDNNLYVETHFFEQEYKNNAKEEIKIDGEIDDKLIISSAAKHEMEYWKHEQEVKLRVLLGSTHPITVECYNKITVPLNFETIEKIHVTCKSDNSQDIKSKLDSFMKKYYLGEYDITII